MFKLEKSLILPQKGVFLLNNFYDKFIFANALKYKNNNFFLADLPFLVCPVELLSGLLETQDQDFERKLYLAIRESVSKHLIPSFGAEFGLRGKPLVDFLEKYFVASGWGTISNIDLDFEAKKAIVRVSNNPVSSRLHFRAAAPADHILRGVLAGIFSRVFEEKMDCVETHCCALGEQECEFIIKKQHDFDFSDKRVMRQVELLL